MGDEVSPVDVVGDTLEGYARRGVFRGFGRGPVQGHRASFRLVWHHGRSFECELDSRRQTLRFPVLFPGVEVDSYVNRTLKRFLQGRRSEDLPEHRRVDRSKVAIRSLCRGGRVSLLVEVKDGDWEYGTRKLVHVVQELFLDLLSDGRGYSYLVDAFGLNADPM